MSLQHLQLLGSSRLLFDLAGIPERPFNPMCNTWRRIMRFAFVCRHDEKLDQVGTRLLSSVITRLAPGRFSGVGQMLPRTW